MLFLAFPILLQFSCVVQSPKYATIDQVMSLRVGMSKAQVEKNLGIKPYDLKMFNDTCNVFIYVYRVTDRRTISLYTTPVNGKEAKGRYLQLDVTYSMDDKVLRVETCRFCANNLVTTSKIDFEKVFLFVTITLPVILVYLGLK